MYSVVLLQAQYLAKLFVKKEMQKANWPKRAGWHSGNDIAIGAEV